MNMATTHAMAVVKNNCYKAPRAPRTNKLASMKKHKSEFESTSASQVSEESLNDSRSSETGTSTVGRHVYDKNKNIFLQRPKDDVVSEEQFYQNLVRLREEHKKTLKLLETRYYDEITRQKSFQWEGFSNGVGLREYMSISDGSASDLETSDNVLRQSRDKRNEQWTMQKHLKSPSQDVVKDMSHSTSTDECDSKISEEDEVIQDGEKASNSPEEFSSSLFPKRSAAVDMVEHLWKDFSVRDYVTENDTIDEPAKYSKGKEWTPAITVPKPFAMTLREARTERRKTRSMQMLEEDLVVKKSMEEAELKKKFRAQPVPATTFIPLYDEIMDNHKRRSEHIREINKAILKATEKPFSFVKREEVKKHKKEKEKMLDERRKAQEAIKRAIFKARPSPKHVDDLTLADRLTEQEEYRKIRKKLRAAELLASSHLPPSMEARAKLTTAARSRKHCHKSHDWIPRPRFRPNINPDVPDFNALHWEFEKELRKRKKERQPTVVEPFNLQTAHIPRARSGLRRTRSLENLSHKFESPLIRRRLRPQSARLSTSQDTLPFGTTESVRLRDNAVKKSLEERKEKRDESSRVMKEKRRREKQLRSQVSSKAMANDHSWLLKKSSEEKLKSFRETERGRQEEYERELAEMKERVEQRPLLFERESRANAKRKAERKYTQILRDAGVDEDLVSRLVTRDGGIIDADSDDSVSEVHREENEGQRELDENYDHPSRDSVAQLVSESEYSEQSESSHDDFN